MEEFGHSSDNEDSGLLSDLRAIGTRSAFARLSNSDDSDDSGGARAANSDDSDDSDNETPTTAPRLGEAAPRRGKAAPRLGEDNFDLLKKAKAKIAEKSRANATGVFAGASSDSAAKLEVNVDLNDEKNLADLEDPGLKEHMRRARERLVEQERAMDTLPTPDALKREDARARQALSSIMTGLKDQQMNLQCALEEISLHSSNADRLATGDMPHGYPKTGTRSVDANLQGNMRHLAKRISGTAASVGDTLTVLAELERHLTLARRNYEAVVDGYARRVERLEQSKREITDELAEK